MSTYLMREALSALAWKAILEALMQMGRYL
jgi:hypothetical protein